MPLTLHQLLVIVFILGVIGAGIFLIKRAPIIDEPIKSFIVWVLIIFGALYLIYTVAGMLGIS